MSQKKFQRKKESFKCEQCGQQVSGNGYTNHCPNCLWSKHVDIMPGDRAANCQGLMRPTDVNLDHGKWFVVHTCEVCGHNKRNKISNDDDFSVILSVSRKKELPIKRYRNRQ